MKKLLLLVSSAVLLLSQGGLSQISTASALFLNMNVDPQGVALGGSHGGIVKGLRSLQYNPAGLSYQNKMAVNVFTSSYLADVSISDFSLAIPFESSAVAIRFKALNSGSEKITTTEQIDGTGSTWEYTATVVGVSWANQFTDKVSFGATLNFFNEGIEATSGSAVAVDMGVQYRTANGVGFGIALKNIGSEVNYQTSDNVYLGDDNQSPHDRRLQSFALPAQFEMSLAYNYSMDEENELMVSSRYTNSSANVDEYGFGAQYSYNGMFDARLSYIMLQESDISIFGGFAFGAGLNFDLSESSSLRFSYSMKAVDESAFDNPSYLGISLDF